MSEQLNQLRDIFFGDASDEMIANMDEADPYEAIVAYLENTGFEASTEEIQQLVTILDLCRGDDWYCDTCGNIRNEKCRAEVCAND